MDLLSLGAFVATLFVASLVPGPGMAAIFARVLGRGRDGAVTFAIGMAVGDIIWLTCGVLGLAVIAQTFHGVFLAIKYAGAAYLLYLAWRLWTTPAAAPDLAPAAKRDHPGKLFAAGLALNLGNPKVMLFYLALLPTFFDLATITVLGYVELVAATVATLALVVTGYITLANRARRLLKSPRAVRLVNRGSGAVMATAAIAIATR